MPYNLLLHEEASKEFLDAVEYYESQKKGLGSLFTNAVDDKLLQIQADPNYYSFVYAKYRQAKVSGFPFVIVYEVFPKKETIHISSIAHTKRKPQQKFRKRKG